MSQPHAEGHGEEGRDVSEQRRERPSNATVGVVAYLFSSCVKSSISHSKHKTREIFFRITRPTFLCASPGSEILQQL